MTTHPLKLTKKLRKEFARTLIDLQPIGKPFSRSDLVVFSWLVGEDASNAVRVPNPQYPKDSRHVLVDGQSFSWAGRIDGITDEQKLKKIMRNIIAPDLRDFLSAMSPGVCERCGTADDLTTDHADVPFDVIASEFIRDHAPIALEKNDNGVGYRFADLDLEAEWIAYHAANATYQVLCRSCNASKGKLEVAA